MSCHDESMSSIDRERGKRTKGRKQGEEKRRKQMEEIMHFPYIDHAFHTIEKMKETCISIHKRDYPEPHWLGSSSYHAFSYHERKVIESCIFIHSAVLSRATLAGFVRRAACIPSIKQILSTSRTGRVRNCLTFIPYIVCSQKCKQSYCDLYSMISASDVWH